MNKTIARSAILMLVIVTAAVSGYEISLRQSGLGISYDDGPELWADKRADVYETADDQMVFIGSSRIKFDLDIPTWRAETGIEPIQLACVGSTPVPVLEDLANDPNFRGRLVIDVTEPIFFSNLPPYTEKPGKGLKYFHDHTLAQDMSFALNHLVESQLVMLDREKFAMNAQLDLLPYLFPALQNRPGVFQMPSFPTEFDRTTFDRQTYMSDRFAEDPDQYRIVQDIWKGLMNVPMPPPPSGEALRQFLAHIKDCTDRIKARGGKILFVRTPSSGPFLEAENRGFPRAQYWNQLLEATKCQGIHFNDFERTKHFICPEFSHLKQADARKFTKALVRIMSENQDWDVQSQKLLTKI